MRACGFRYFEGLAFSSPNRDPECLRPSTVSARVHRPDSSPIWFMTARPQTPDIPDIIESHNPNARGFAERTAANTPLHGSDADSASLSLVPTGTRLRVRPRNCFTEPFCWVASIKGSRRSLSGPAPRRSVLLPPATCSAEGRRVKSCSPSLANRWACWDAATVSKNAQTKGPSIRINKFAYANRLAIREARKRRKLLATKTFAFANCVFVREAGPTAVDS
jgi:hypothetical protein